MMRPVRSVLWGALTLAVNRYVKNSDHQVDRLVQTIHLHSDGRHVDFTFMSGRKLLNLDISSIQI